DPARAPHVQGQHRRVAFDDPLTVEPDGDGEVGGRKARQADREEYGERDRERDQLGPSEDDRRKKRCRREHRVVAELRQRGARHAGASSVGGVGTESSTSRTTPSPRTSCTQSSGLSVSLWASAGTATAFTSSGRTKSRPARAARQRESFSNASEPRGLAPT